MKWIAIILLSLAVILYGLNFANRKEVGIEQRADGLYYKIGATTAFTGDGLVYHPNGQKMQQGKFELGKQIGPWKVWHPNGQLHWEGSYKDGKKDGVWTQYDEQGTKSNESTWQEGMEQIIIEQKSVNSVEPSNAVPTGKSPEK